MLESLERADNGLASLAARRALCTVLAGWPTDVPFAPRALGGSSKLIEVAKLVAASEGVFSQGATGLGIQSVTQQMAQDMAKSASSFSYVPSKRSSHVPSKRAASGAGSASAGGPPGGPQLADEDEGEARG